MPLSDDVFNYNYFKRRQYRQEQAILARERKLRRQKEQEERDGVIESNFEPAAHFKPDGSPNVWKMRKRFHGRKVSGENPQLFNVEKTAKEIIEKKKSMDELAVDMTQFGNTLEKRGE